MKRFWMFMIVLGLAGKAAALENLAILPFTGGEGEDGETIAELFSFVPRLNEVFNPIPRTTITQAVEREQSFQLSSGMTDPDTIAAIGRQLGAGYVAAGSITAVGRYKLLVISIVKIDDLRQVAGDYQTYSNIVEIRGKLPRMVDNIIDMMDSPGAEQLPKLAVTPVQTLSKMDQRGADVLAQILAIDLIRLGKYTVYPRTSSLEQVQFEYWTELSGATAEEETVSIGRGENPGLVLSVAARRLGNAMMFNAAIINLETGAQVAGTSVNYESVDEGITAMGTLAAALAVEPAPPEAAPPEAAKRPRSQIERNLETGALNLLLGLGSFLEKDYLGGATIVEGYALAGALLAWELTRAYDDPLAGIPGPIGVTVAGLTAAWGFVRPFLYNRNPSAAKALDGVRVGVVPEAGGGRSVKALSLGYRVRF